MNAAPMRSRPRIRSAKPVGATATGHGAPCKQAVGGAAERDATDRAVVGGADDEQAGAAILGEIVEDVGRGRPGQGDCLERDAVEGRLDRREAGERGAADTRGVPPPIRTGMTCG